MESDIHTVVHLWIYIDKHRHEAILVFWTQHCYSLLKQSLYTAHRVSPSITQHLSDPSMQYAPHAALRLTSHSPSQKPIQSLHSQHIPQLSHSCSSLPTQPLRSPPFMPQRCQSVGPSDQPQRNTPKPPFTSKTTYSCSHSHHDQ